jgi:hypothetical protein
MKLEENKKDRENSKSLIQGGNKLGKMVMIINVTDDEVNTEGIQFAFDESFQGIANVESIYESFYENDEPLTLTAVSVSQDVEGKFTGEYTDKQLVAITNWVADSETLTQCVDDTIDYAIEELTEKGLL